MTTRSAFACCIAVFSPLLVMAEAQVIRVKTIAVAESEQFSFLPLAGMAGVSIALADTLLDPFVNPAKGARVRTSQYFGAPSFFSTSGNSGAGTTLPLGATFRRGSSFGGLGAAFQQIHRPTPPVNFFRGAVQSSSGSFAPPPPQQQPTSHRNRYTFAISQ